MTRARGKYAYGFCDRSGFRYDLADLVYEFRNGVRNGLRVGKDMVDQDHPQNFLGRVRTEDAQSLNDPRPDSRVEPDVERILINNPFTSAVADSGNTVITVTEVTHGRSSSDTVRFRTCDPFDGISKSALELSSGYSITVVTTDTYTFTVAEASTTGGIKIFRFQILFRGVRLQIKKLTKPHAVFLMKFNHKTVTENTYLSIISFFFIYVLLFIFTAVSLSLFGLDFLTALSASASAISNVGPGIGEIIGPNGNYASINDAAKWILAITMLVGRLEIFTILVLFSKNFWTK